MSKPLHQTAAADAFVRGENPRTHAALTFEQGFAYSYGEPVAILAGSSRVWITSGRFSVTTTRHTNQVARAAARAGMEVVEKDHGTMRKAAKALGLHVGQRGAHYEVAA